MKKKKEIKRHINIWTKMLMKTNKENIFMFRNYKSQVSVKLNYISTKQQLVFLRTHETEIKPKSFSNYVHGFTFIKCNLKHMVSDGSRGWKDSWIKSTHGKQKPKCKTAIKTKIARKNLLNCITNLPFKGWSELLVQIAVYILNASQLSSQQTRWNCIM